MFNNQIIAGAAGQGGSFYSYSIDQSLRFNDDDSAYLSRTPASAGNRKTFTFSAWIKVNPAATNYPPIFSADNTAPDFVIRLSNTGSLQVVVENGGGGNSLVLTNRLFRDPSSWYHLVVTIDTTNATANDRIKVYVNGVEETSFSSRTNPSLNFDTKVNSTVLHRLGLQRYGSYWDGYMAEVNFIDGTALDATSFGETSNGVWVPKAYSGSYGTNGFYLSFADSAAIGDDLSGNTNDFTATNLAAHDVVPDSPTNNFATLNENDETGLNAFGEGSLRYSGASASSFGITRATFSASNHKCYWETYGASTPTDFRVGLMQTGQRLVSSSVDYLGLQSRYPGSVAFEPNTGRVRQSDGTHSSVYTVASGGDVINHAFDPETGKYYVGINGTYINSGDPAAGTGNIDTLSTTDTFAPAVSDTATGNKYFNFGQDGSFAGNKTSGGYSDDNGNGDFFNQPPTGFLALCSASIPEPSIGPNSTTTSDEHFNTVLYTGTGASNSITVGFQPDFTWIKRRDATADHQLVNSVVGYPDGTLLSNQTDAEYTAAARVDSRDSNGFTVSTPTQVNASGGTYASWNWKAGGTAVSNTDGSITSQVSANTDAGFSIVGFTSTGNTETVGHGLSQAPELYIRKSRTNAEDWVNFFTVVDGTLDFMNFNTTNAASGSGASLPTSTVFSIGGGETNGETHIAYCFHSSDVCKVGSYVGNGSSTDGTFVFIGFRPAWVMAKRTDSTGAWTILDNKRDPFNEVDTILNADATTTESSFGTTNRNVDFLSNGFKIRDTAAGGLTDLNANGGSYAYLAFAEAPFKYANAR